ncbi:MAG: hypothetical protein LBB49_05925 [Gracilibacteraceae bacterium]|nr:hypothetical protein [Gracilibacteraceae bacterium]
MNTATKVVVIVVGIYLAYWLFRNYIIGILGFCFWLIRGIVFLALILALVHLLLKFFFGVHLLNLLKELWR